MWLLVCVPMVLICTILISCYLQKDRVYEDGKSGINIGNIIAMKPSYILFLAVVFVLGIVAFGMQYNYFEEYIKASKLTFLIMLLSPIAYIDYKSNSIPNELILTGFLARLVFYVIEMFSKNEAILEIFISDMKGLLLGGGVFLIGALVMRNAIGMGDAKMYAIIGIFMGYYGTIISLMFSLFVCFIAAIGLLAMRKKTRKDTIPLAPFVLIGTFLAIFLGNY
ncbi:A24 family peptidase [Herbivorax sp. ANBcel31]|uniref:prepilin peptidase n=1 Tax=Herbivorax sp. ANBcel31 TaxID=3069754 RepID=UPI0027B7912F|nr:A24 family peptidase [Herbivorax sp. ANBcel31]MDQ2085073.1 A24 family peptidase [Herbivorax sp. ANBcel31]